MVRAEPSRKGATYEDVLAAPENHIAELMGGSLHVQPRPARPHGRAASTLGGILLPPFQLGRGGPGGWWIEDEPELHLGDAVLVTDLAGWRREVMPSFDTSVSYVTTAPQWVCEVLSPSTAGKDRVLKLPLYGKAGVEHAWLVDPLARTLEVFANDAEGTWRLIGTYDAESIAHAAPFEAVAVHLPDLWL